MRNKEESPKRVKARRIAEMKVDNQATIEEVIREKNQWGKMSSNE
jgi:predicted RNA-binding protein